MFIRHLAALLCATAAMPALADRIDATARTTHVTVFPQGAAIDWRVDLTAEPGRHEVILPDLPQGLDPSSLRLAATGARIGAFALQSDRALPGTGPDAPAVTLARADLMAARDALVDFDARIAARHASAKAWQERAALTRDLMRGDDRVPADVLQALVDQAGGMVADHLARAAEETREASLLENRRDEVLRRVERAEQALAAVLDQSAGHETLVLTVEITESPASLTLTGFTDAAGWQPDYDLRLDRASGRLDLDRGAVVEQASGIDWQDVTLTLSTARPSGQTAPSSVQPWLPRIGEPLRSMARAADAAAPVTSYAEMAEPSMVVDTAALTMIGITATYDYASPVTIRDGADALRLSLERSEISADVLAEAAPRHDDRAYVVAEAANTTAEPILPGQATLYLDGTMVGRTTLELTAPGDDLRLGFGPIDGLTAELRTPEESEGDQGILRRKNRLTLSEALIVTNLTSENWPLRVIDRVPVSTQQDLQIDWSADPAPSETEPDGQRGILWWNAPLAAGESRTITLNTDLRWPEGKELFR